MPQRNLSKIRIERVMHAALTAAVSDMVVPEEGYFGGDLMAYKGTTAHFNCPNCNALYQIVKVEAGPETDNREITCRACGGPLAGRDGIFVCKYFLLRKSARPDPRARRGSQRHIREV